MRKKYLSALLFGALLFASAGTFTSCKDYDDDIDNLQSQISANASAIEALKKVVESGDYVTGVEKSATGLTITFKNAGAKTIALEDKVGSIVTVENGVLCIDGKATEIKVAEPTEPTEHPKDQIIIENGVWSVLQEDGTYKSTGIPVSGVTVTGNEVDGFTLTIYDENGEPQVVKLPTASSRITDLVLTPTAIGNTKNNLEIAQYIFGYAETSSDKWNGPRKVPAKNSVIVSSTSQLSLQVNPTDVDATSVEFKLVDSKNNYPSGVVLKAAEDKSLLTTTGREAFGNGKYLLTMKDAIFANATAAANYMGQFTSSGNQKLYAVTTGKVRTAYDVVAKDGARQALTNINVTPDFSNYIFGASEVAVGTNIGTLTANNNKKLEMNTWYYLTATQSPALYDMYVHAVNDDLKVLYGLEFKNEEGTYAFRFTKTPDNVTKPSFGIVVETMSKTGDKKKTTIYFAVSETISSQYAYEKVEYTLQDKEADKNRFSIDLADFKTSLGTEGLALWNQKVNASSVKFYKASDNSVVSTPGITVDLVKKVEDGTAQNVTNPKDAKFLKFKIENATAGAAFAVGTDYYAVITFTDASRPNANELNSIKVPFKFALPAINTLFTLDQNFVIDGTAVCYLYAADKAYATADGNSTFNLSRVFSKITSVGFKVALDNETAVSDTKTSRELAVLRVCRTMSSGAASTGNGIAQEADGNVAFRMNYKDNYPSDTNSYLNTYITLTGGQNSTTGLHEGYGKVLKLNVTGKFANAWNYPEGENVYSFTVKVLSPIYEGNVTAKTGSVVSIPASSLNGYKFGNNEVIGNTYNSQVTYQVAPVWNGTASAWSRNDIAKVTMKSTNTNIFTIATDPIAAIADTPASGTTPAVKNDGYWKITAQNAPQNATGAVEVTVKDIWGYIKTSKVDVKITVE